jgi:thioredoxin reductase
MLDAIIVGGGPAGLSAALVLARCRRSVLVFDDGHPRNSASTASHNFLSRDGVPGLDLLRFAREDLQRYGVNVVAARVVHARCAATSRDCDRTTFEVTLATGQTHRCRKLLLATGVRDVLPEIDGFAHFYGRGVHHCPYCDAYEYGDGRLVAFGEATHAAGLAMSLRTWSDRITVCTDASPLPEAQRQRLKRNGVAVREESIARLEGDDRLRRVVFDDGAPLDCDALFFSTSQTQQSDLPRMLGCEIDDNGKVVTQRKQHTCVSGLYLAGDADGDVQFLIVAAAEGATAATAINRDLQDETCGEADAIEDAWRFSDR